VSPVARGLEVFVLARPVFQDEAALAFLRAEQETWREDETASDAERLVELAGRVCYMSFGARQSARSNREYIGNLISQGHESVLEHAAWTFVITGVSRTFTHQLVRHRAGFSFSQLSQQYHDERAATAVRPGLIAGDAELTQLWERHVAESIEAYRRLVDELEERDELAEQHSPKERMRAIRSAARSLLPGSVETKIVVTANARALRHFLTSRGSLTGDEEMRRVSVALLRELQKDAPALFQDFAIEIASDREALVKRLS
jgi:thymidylate synthase (FAD)